MSTKQFKRWDEYQEEAAGEPFRLEVSEEETLEFTMPSGIALMRIHQGLREGDLALILHAVTGEHWPRVEQLLETAGHKSVAALTEDLLDHFDIYEKVTLVGPSGGRVVRKRPREIRAMIEQGYRPVGEAPASNG